jgi:hypothetical protein
MPHRVPGQPFAGCVRRMGGPRQRSGQCLRLLVTLALLGFVLPGAVASLPDPLWIGGVYDNADYDGLMALSEDLHALEASRLVVDRSSALSAIRSRNGGCLSAGVCLPFRPRSPPATDVAERTV